MRCVTAFVGGLGLVALLATAAAAQQSPASTDGKATPPARMGMHGMMAGCEDHAKLTAEVTTALARVREAQASTDPVALKAALGEADRTLTAVQVHFGKCGAMMEKMKGGAPPAGKADEHKH